MHGLLGLNRKNEGNQIFADELTRFAHQSADQRLTAIAERTAAPLRVLVRGRRGVGCSTVARALELAGGSSGISVAKPGSAADLEVYVIAEVVKPEDRRLPGALTVLNKADLTGFRESAGPIAAAQRRCAEFAPLLGSPVLPVSGLLAVAALDGLDSDCWAALQELGGHPGTTYLDGSFDGFLAAQIPVPVPVRRRLLETLDLFGVALAVETLRHGGGPEQVRALLRRLSGIDAVIEALSAAGAEVRYRRMLDAVADLDAAAVKDPAIGEFLAGDDTVIARMSAALDAMQADGVEPGPGAPLPRAVHWQRLGRTPVSDLHRACAADIVRGSLRLWSRSDVPIRSYRESR